MRGVMPQSRAGSNGKRSQSTNQGELVDGAPAKRLSKLVQRLLADATQSMEGGAALGYAVPL